MKKNIFIIALSIAMSEVSQAQSITLKPDNVKETLIVKKSGIGISQESLEGVKVGFFADESANGAGYLQTHSNHPLGFSTNNGTIQMYLLQNGNFGIGNNFVYPTAKLHVDGYTKLGNVAPAIKMIKFTGNTAATQGDKTQIIHGLTARQILSISVVIDLGSAGNVFENYTQSAGYQVGTSFENTNIYIWNSPTNSANILNKPFKVLVTYEE